ncbi:MAG: hypothetical protein ACOC03_03990 [Desulfosalsimonas sp.]
MLKRFLAILAIVAMMGITMGCNPPEDAGEQPGQQQQQQGGGSSGGSGGSGGGGGGGF